MIFNRFFSTGDKEENKVCDQIRNEHTHPEFCGTIPCRPFEEYSKRYNDFFHFKKSENGILEARWHTDNKELSWDLPIHRAIHQLTTDVGQDTNIECFILGGWGNNWIADQKSSINETENKWVYYEHLFYDGCNISEGLIYDIEVHTIGVINGPGFHTEIALLCDITLISDDANIMDPHCAKGITPGDGVQIALRECMGIKRANYVMLMGEVITPDMALKYGLVNEVVPKEKIWDRAWEIAEKLISQQSRVQRRATVQVLREPWKKRLAAELRGNFGIEMMANMITGYTPQKSGSGHAALMRKLGAELEHMDK